jgi:hypothetical protein
MPFIPSNANLGSHLELENFFYSISYTNSFGTSFPVTITTDMFNTSVTVTSNTIYNYYSEVFTSNTIVYLSKDRTDVTTSSWLAIEDIVNRADTFSSILEIYKWSPDSTGCQVSRLPRCIGTTNPEDELQDIHTGCDLG